MNKDLDRLKKILRELVGASYETRSGGVDVNDEDLAQAITAIKQYYLSIVPKERKPSYVKHGVKVFTREAQGFNQALKELREAINE